MIDDPWSPLLGGALIGAAASALLLLNGRIAGVSGVVGELLRPRPGEVGWRLAFLAGLAVGGLLLAGLAPDRVPVTEPPRPTALIVGAGLLVGVGTRLANGCTSGHGVCGLPRGAARSWTATAVFMGTGALVASLIGGAP
jgi:uncharacterized membrane protein YedE/YeeE